MKSWFWLAKLDEIAEMLRYAPAGASGTSAAAMKWAAVRDKVDEFRKLVAAKHRDAALWKQVEEKQREKKKKKKKGKKRGAA